MSAPRAVQRVCTSRRLTPPPLHSPCRSLVSGIDAFLVLLSIMIVCSRNPYSMKCILCLLASFFFVQVALVVWVTADISVVGAAKNGTAAYLYREANNGMSKAVIDTLLPYTAALLWRGYGIFILNAYHGMLMAQIGETKTLLPAPGV